MLGRMECGRPKSELGRIDLDYLLATLDCFDEALVCPDTSEFDLVGLRDLVVNDLLELLQVVEHSYQRARLNLRRAT